MLNLVDEFYAHDNNSFNGLLSKEKYERLTSNIRVAFDSLMVDVDTVNAYI
jgi:hypothetical protein